MASLIHHGDEDESESPIRVVVAPAQSSYFAGETIAVTITFTNTHSPDAVSIPTPTTATTLYTHKRGSHSISSAPLARPPTSPGMPSRSVVVPGLGASPVLGRAANHRRRHHGHNSKEKGEEEEVPRRKGLIGRPLPPREPLRAPVVVGSKSSADVLLPELIEQRRRRLLAKSLSVSVSPSELERQLPEGTLVKTRALSIISEGSTSSRLSSSSRSPTPPSSPAFEETRSVSASTSTSTAPSSPVVSPTHETTTTTTAVLGPKTAHRPSSLDLAPVFSFSYSQPSPAPSDSTSPYLQPRTASSPSFPIPLASHPRTELILYAYAQLTGSLVLLPLPADSPESSPSSLDAFDKGDRDGGTTGQEAEGMKRLRARLMKRTVVGGGRMDITPSLQFQRSSSGTTGSETGLGTGSGMGTGTGLGTGLGTGSGMGTGPVHPRSAPRPRPRPGHGRSTSLSAAFFSSLLSPTSPTSPEKSGGGAPWSSRDHNRANEGDPVLGIAEDVDPEEPLPMFDSQPSMLAVDLSLGPGESKSYTYSIELPSALPPTFRGRVIRFSYELSVGVCRSACGPLVRGMVLSPPPSLASGNGVSRVVKVPIRVYNYVAVGRVPRPYDLLWPVGRRIREGKVQGEVVEVGKARPVRDRGTVEEFREYARRMFTAEERPKEEEEEEERIGCREAVEILTRNAKKVSYEVNKDGEHVAMLTFTKSAYRLGETVLGVVEFNDREGRTRVLQMSAMLEAHEKVPSGLGPSGVVVRRVHAEQRQSFVMSVERTTFSLDIPSDASPAFEVGVGEGGGGGLEWRVRLCLVVAGGGEMRGMEEDGVGGRWGRGWVASGSIVPFEKRVVGERRGWSLWGGRGEWERAQVSRVECSVPVGVCAAHTAFKAVSVVFGL
ncbi:hypothetical protein APHAL10511_008230 [Amanita phalloides]|nr:hypothetical protein APHAL10511_008230 [Amanita phalloides]